MPRIPSANPYNIQPGESSPWADLSGQRAHINNRYRGPATWVPRLATMGVTAGLGAAAAPLLFGAMGGGAATGAAASTAPAVTTAARFTLPNILRMAEIGVPAVAGIFANRAQGKALDRQSAMEQQNIQAQMDFAREQEAIRRAEAERMFTEDQRRFDTSERNTKEQRDFERRLIEEREARRAPYREASRQALFRLQELINMGRRR